MLLVPVCQQEGNAEIPRQAVNLLATAGQWTGPDAPQIIEAGEMFAYMNGAAELYLAYQFDHLEVFEYTAEEQDDILVEIYAMETSDDAFGLFSLDWEGEPVTFSSEPADSSVALPQRALYDGGWLRMCAGSVYARIMTYQETPESRDAVLALGQMIAENRAQPAEPEIVQMLPQRIGSDWAIRQDRVAFFRSHQVLNSLYYLSHENLLNLNHSTEAVFAPYQRNAETETTQQVVYVIGVRYASSEHAQDALKQCHTAYLSKQHSVVENEKFHTIRYDDGWGGFRRNGASLTLIFEGPDQDTVRTFAEHISGS